MQFICLDGNIVPSWKSLVSIFSEQLAQLLEDVEPNDGMISVSVHENAETILAILSAIKGERKSISETDIKTAFDLGIYLDSEKSRLNKTDHVEIFKAIIDSVHEEQDYLLETQIIGDKPSKEKGEIIDDEVATDKPIKTEKSDKIIEVMTKVSEKERRLTKAKKHDFILSCVVCKAKTGFRSRSAHHRQLIKS